MEPPETTCLFCKHFSYSTGEPDYSDVTPGNPPSINCGKGHWYWDQYGDSLDEYRAKMLKAQTCPDFLKVVIR